MLATKAKSQPGAPKDSSGLITQLAACKILAIAAGASAIALARSVAATDGASGVSKSAVVLELLCRHLVHRCDSLDPAAGWTHLQGSCAYAKD